MPITLDLSAVLTMLTLAAAPSEPPRWNTDAICARIIKGAGATVLSREQCKQSQDDALTELRQKWSSYPVDLRGRCTDEAGLAGQTSYVDLIECINLGVASAQSERSLSRDRGAGGGGSPSRP